MQFALTVRMCIVYCNPFQAYGIRNGIRLIVLMVFDAYPELRARGGERHLWARRCYVSMVGNVNEETIQNYICNQENSDQIETSR